MKTDTELWLEEHPRRGATWLNMAINDGFVIYRTSDGGCILVYGQDVDKIRDKQEVMEEEREPSPKPFLSLGEQAYWLRSDHRTWEEVGKEIGRGWMDALHLAKSYAKIHKQSWPVRM
jgi:hypothetical protein